MDTGQPAPDAPCGICDHPHQGHGTRYTAGRGDHTWTEPKGMPFRTHTELHAAAEAERARDWPAPRIVPHPDGGVTMTCQPEPAMIHAPETELATVRAPETEPAVHLGEIDYTAPARTSIIRRILGATRSTT